MRQGKIMVKIEAEELGGTCMLCDCEINGDAGKVTNMLEAVCNYNPDFAASLITATLRYSMSKGLCMAELEKSYAKSYRKVK